VGKCVKFSQITYFSRDKSILYVVARVLHVHLHVDTTCTRNLKSTVLMYITCTVHTYMTCT
jgi:hypothetical protein